MARQPKHTAILSLGVMAAGFAVTFPFLGAGAGALLHGGFEAGLVGGLADWFAVTALFRRPLGLPIPHTALLPRNRDKVVRSLVNVMENEFLTKDSIKSKVNGYLTPERMVGLAERHLEDAVSAAVKLSEYALRQLPLERIVPVLAREVRGLIGKLDTAALLRLASEAVISRDLDEKVLLYLLAKAEDLASRDSVRRQLGAMAAQSLANVQAKGFMGFAVGAFAGFMSEDKLGDMLQNAILSNLRGMRAYPDHPLRQMVFAEMRRALEELPENETALRELNEAKEKLPDRLDLEVSMMRWGEELRGKALAFLETGRFADEVVRPALSALVERYKRDSESLVPVQQWLQTRIAGVIDDNHSRIGQLVRENLDKLDNATLIRMIEEKIGGDLQWIRVNGAVCGFLIGLVLEGINLLS